MPQGRPLNFVPEQALDAAMHVFWAQGYEGTSMQDLLASMNLSKSSFYQTFGSKHDLFQECLQLFRQRTVAHLRKSLEESPSGLEFLRRTLTGMAQEARCKDSPKGCLIMNTATEFAGRDTKISRLVTVGTEHFSGVFREAIERAQKEGDIPSDRDAQLLALHVLTTVGGLKAMIKAGVDADAIEKVAEISLRALN